MWHSVTIRLAFVRAVALKNSAVTADSRSMRPSRGVLGCAPHGGLFTFPTSHDAIRPPLSAVVAGGRSPSAL